MDEKLSSVTTKQDLIDYTTTEWDALVAYVDGLTADQWTSPKDAAGWSVKDHVTHVTQWDRAVIELLRNGGPMQETLGISETAWSAGSYDPMNEEVRRLAVTDSVHRVKAERDATWTDLVSLMSELSEEQLARPGAKVGLAIGETTRCPRGVIYSAAKPVLQVLVDYWGAHYGEHLRSIRAIVGGEPG